MSLMNLGKVVALAFHYLNRGLRRLPVNVKAQDQKHVHRGEGFDLLAVPKDRESSIYH